MEVKSGGGRIVAFDLAESLAIFMACSLHYPLFVEGSFAAEIWQLLCIGAVPAFFMINGCLLFSRPFDMKKHVRRIVNIILGLLFWKTLILLAFIVFGFADMALFNPETIVSYYFTAAKIGDLPTAHMWFMYALLAIYILFPMLKMAYEGGLRKYIVALIVLGLITIPLMVDFDWLMSFVFYLTDGGISVESRFSDTVATLYPFGTWGMYLIFFLMGPFVWRWVSSSIDRYGRLKVFAASLVGMVLFVAIALLQDFVYQGSFTWSGLVLPDQYKHIVTVGVACSLIALCASIPLKKGFTEGIFILVSKNTLTVYYAHLPLLWLFARYVSIPQGFLWSIVQTFGVVVVSVLLGEVMKRIPGLRRVA